jgi:NAD(P)H-quinone oxidoreductase subunit 4L
MVMMGLELMVNGVLFAGGGLWAFLAPAPQVQVALLVVISAMTVEMALGFAVTVLLYRSREVDMVDMATDLSG